ncbi:hypothetical protein Clacol_000425 [Clathrus columnatus]|uniref:Uncharacterized protein n=1 Tax=Clathrus columnatus TaxID=1419009 RepID=A0AAV5A2X8_9AGAM|nr:hypothetical protein Clacol_000425 [Clathrus columnatus]
MKAQDHVFQYAKTGRAKCRGGCGDNIAQGTLRYGMKYVDQEYGETTMWSHWECASKALRNLAGVNLNYVPGFRALRLQDQERVQRDVRARKILPAVSTLGPSSSETSIQPPSSQPSSTPSHMGQTAGQKRKRPQETGIKNNPSMDDDEYFDSSQDEAKDELYISLTAKIVGIQYYQGNVYIRRLFIRGHLIEILGLVGPGEEVTLVREPFNRFDRNAIQVLNISGLQVGHIPRNIAEKLAPLIDSNQIAVEGVMQEGNIVGRKQYALGMTLKIYGSSQKRPQLEPSLIWATPRQQGFTDAMRLNLQTLPSATQPIAGPSSSGSSGANQRAAQQRTATDLQKAADLRLLLSSLEKVDDEGRRASLLDIVCPTEDILNMPTHPNPPSVAGGQLKVDLLRHQVHFPALSQALKWCIDRENPILPRKASDKPVQFWQYQTGGTKQQAFYLNLITHSPQTHPPILGRGGLMADAMGLGKTLTMLALVAATKSDVSEQFSGATLIVVPVSVISNWKTQIHDHFTEGALTYHLYYEAGRSTSPEKLTTYDIVITSYQTVTTDFNSSGGLDSTSAKKRKLEEGLFGVKWKRIILDEGHTIRNPKTKMSLAVKALEAERRWVVSGTPIINSPKDLGSLLQFLRICHPLDNEEYFKRLILRPIAQTSPEGAELLKAVMSHICIRRTKEMQNEKGEYLIPLPPVEMTLIPVALDEATRMPTNVLSLLTRLRQLTLHPGLIPRNYVEQLRAMSSDVNTPPLPAMPITSQDRIRLQAVLARAIEDSEECPICFEVSGDPRITPCAHIFCLACITEVISRDPRCPMDRRTINISNLIVPPPPSDLTQAPPPREEEVEEDTFTSSAKIDQLIHLLQLIPKNEKSLIAEALDQAGISYVKFDGQMSARRRQEVLEKFSKPLREQENLGSTSQAHTNQRRSLRSSSKQNIGGPTAEDDADEGDDFVPSDDDDLEVDSPKKSKGKSKKKNNKNNFDDDLDFLDNPVVMLISLKAGALGLNLTVANNLVAEDTVETKVLEIQDRKKKLIREAFSGLRSTETQRQKKEARLQGRSLVEELSWSDVDDGDFPLHIALAGGLIIAASPFLSTVPRLILQAGEETTNVIPMKHDVSRMITTLALDQSQPAGSSYRLVVFYSTGPFSVFLVNPSNLRESREIITYTSSDNRRLRSGTIIQAAYHHPLLVTLSSRFDLTIYELQSTEMNGRLQVRLRQTLTSFTSHLPTSLILSNPSIDLYRLILAYTAPIYPAHWTAGITEVMISSFAVQTTHSTTAFDMGSAWVPLTPELLASLNEQNDRKLSNVSSVSTDGRYVALASGSINSIQLFRLSNKSRESGIKLTFLRTLHGHLSPIQALAVSDGRCVSLSRDGSLWAWDVDRDSNVEIRTQIYSDLPVSSQVIFDERRILVALNDRIIIHRFDV